MNCLNGLGALLMEEKAIAILRMGCYQQDVRLGTMGEDGCDKEGLPQRATKRFLSEPRVSMGRFQIGPDAVVGRIVAVLSCLLH